MRAWSRHCFLNLAFLFKLRYLTRRVLFRQSGYSSIPSRGLSWICRVSFDCIPSSSMFRYSRLYARWLVISFLLSRCQTRWKYRKGFIRLFVKLHRRRRRSSRLNVPRRTRKLDGTRAARYCGLKTQNLQDCVVHSYAKIERNAR